MFELQFASISEFLQMGEYTFNVWSVYVLFAVFIFINLYYPLLRRKKILKEQKRRQLLQEQAPTREATIDQSESELASSYGENL